MYMLKTLGNIIIVRFFGLALIMFLNPLGSIAQGDLLIYPKRIVFDGSKRTQDLSLVNNGEDTARYVISVVQIRMKEDGSFENISEPDKGQNFADKNFRFYPRSVVLGPKEAQTVRVQLLQFNSLSPGEYRSHLYFRAEKPTIPAGSETTRKDQEKISISIAPVYGLSIPVIIRTGESTTNIELTNAEFLIEKDSIPVVQMAINRSGNMSAYGDISINHISPGGKKTELAFIKGVAVYTPIPKRQVRVALNRISGINYSQGTLLMIYQETSGKTKKAAQLELKLK